MNKHDFSDVLYDTQTQHANQPDFSEVLTRDNRYPVSENGQYKVGSLRPAGGDPYVSPDRMQQFIEQDQQKSRAQSIAFDAVVLGTAKGVHYVGVHNHTWLNVQHNQEVMAREFNFLKSHVRVGHNEYGSVIHEADVRGAMANTPNPTLRHEISESFARRSALFAENSAIKTSASLSHSAMFKTMGAAIVTDAALNQLFFRDSVSSARTFAFDAFVPLALAVGPGSKLGLGLKVGAIASAHLANRYLDYRMEH